MIMSISSPAAFQASKPPSRNPSIWVNPASVSRLMFSASLPVSAISIILAEGDSRQQV